MSRGDSIMSTYRRDPILSTDITRDPSILRQREMDRLRRKIINQRRYMEPLMVTPKDDRLIDYRGSNSINSRLRRILCGPLSTDKSSGLATSGN
jgi:hypothetical protein